MSHAFLQLLKKFTKSTVEFIEDRDRELKKRYKNDANDNLKITIEPGTRRKKDPKQRQDKTVLRNQPEEKSRSQILSRQLQETYEKFLEVSKLGEEDDSGVYNGERT